MMSSDWQLEQTGVDRVARRLTICAGSGFELNGLRSKACLIFFPLTTELRHLPELNAGVTSVSWPWASSCCGLWRSIPHCGSLSTERSGLGHALLASHRVGCSAAAPLALSMSASGQTI